MKSIHDPCPYGNDDCPICSNHKAKSLYNWKKGWEIEFDQRFTDMDDYYIKELKSFISSLLAKQQADFVKCIPEERKLTAVGGSPENCESEGFNQCIADIKSKINEKV